MEAKLHLSIGGNVEAMLDCPFYPSTLPHGGRGRVRSSIALTVPPT
jgi:hypothetical protein